MPVFTYLYKRSMEGIYGKKKERTEKNRYRVSVSIEYIGAYYVHVHYTILTLGSRERDTYIY